MAVEILSLGSRINEKSELDGSPPSLFLNAWSRLSKYGIFDVSEKKP